MNITFRDAGPADTNALLALWAAVFPDKDAAHWRIVRDRLDADPRREAIAIRLMESNGQLIGAVQNELSWLRLGQARFLKADVGYVAVLPRLQGRGLGHRLMEDNRRWLREKGVHVGRLGGLVHFYRRFGWTPTPTRFWRFPLGDVSGGVRVIPFADLVRLDPARQGCIRPFVKERDWAAYRDVHEQFHAEHVASPLLDGPWAAMQRNRRDETELERQVYEQDGRLLAYLFWQAESFASYDLGCRPACEAALLELIRYYLLRARGAGRTDVTCSWPRDDRLGRWVHQAQLRFEWVEQFGGAGSCMIQIVNLTDLARQLLPEWTARSQMPATLTLRCEDSGEEITLVLGSPGGPSVTLAAAQSDLFQLMLGWDDVSRYPVRLDPDEHWTRALLRQLFPRRPVAVIG